MKKILRSQSSDLQRSSLSNIFSKKKLTRGMGIVGVIAIATTLLTIATNSPDTPLTETPLVQDANASVFSGGGASGGGGGGAGAGWHWIEISQSRFNDPDPGFNGTGFAVYNANGAASGLNPANCQAPGTRYYAKVLASGYPAWSQSPVYDRRISNLSAGVIGEMNKQYVNIICENEPPEITSAPYTNFRVHSNVETTSNYSRQGNHSYTITVAPQYLYGADNKLATTDIVGKNNLNAQAESQITDFGKVYEEVEKAKASIQGNKSANLVNTWKPKIQAAADNQRKQITLNANNKAGLAEGGVLNVTEGQKRATITLSSTPTKYTVQYRTFRIVTKNGVFIRDTAVSAWANATGSMSSPNSVLWCANLCRGTSETAERAKYKGTGGALSWYTYNNTANVALNTNPTTGFWQMLSVHCNSEGFDKLKAELGAVVTAENTGGEANGTSGIVHTVKYASAEEARSKNGGALPVGDRNATTPARKASGTLGFYDKECSFECTANPTATGASAQNDASNNVNYAVETNEHGDKNGASLETPAGKVNGNLFEMFRDNQDREIRLNVRYPVTAGNISYNGHAAKTTTVTNWKQGTPGTVLNAANADKSKNNGGIFTVQGKDGKNIFGAGEVKPQKNWDSGLYTSPNSAVIPGHLNKLNTKATWASEVGLPQIVNVKWEYAPSIATNNVPTAGIGFNNSGAKVIGTKTTETTAIEGKCYAQFGKTDNASLDTKKLFLDNTGTGTKNNLDSNILGQGGNKEVAKGDQLNLVLNFVRSTTE